MTASEARARRRSALIRLAAFLGTAALFGLYALGGDHAWPLGFVMLVPWLLVLDGVGRRAALGHGLAMAAATTLAGFAWFGAAIGDYLGIGPVAGIALLVLLAPFFQPQWLAFAVVRQGLRRQHGPTLAAIGAAAAWVATETLVPKLLGDTLGHGLAPSALMRQAADLGGAAGLTVLLLLANEAIATAWRRRQDGRRAWVPAVVVAGLVPTALAAYGALRLQGLAEPPAPAPALRVALVQANQTDYERRRREVGAHAVVREVLDAHYGLSMAALRDHGADVLLWSETVYPTPFGAPRSPDGAAFDAEIQAFVDAMGVPLLFGSYDVDAAGEYNAALLLEPGQGRVGSYRKTHPFPLTEHVPAWLDRPWLRRALPWTGGWQAGDGARLLPLRSADGREVQVQVLICLDDTRPNLALDAARLGAQALVGLSNDSWFTDWPAGARLHLAVARFRSIETRLPQLRVTTNGLSALVDATGDVPVRTAMGQQAVLTGVIAAHDPVPTLMVRWGDWVGRAALGVLALLALWRVARRGRADTAAAVPLESLDAVVLPPAARVVAGGLRLVALGGLGLSAGWMQTRIGWQVQSMDQLWLFGLGVVLPLCGAAAVLRGARARLRIEDGALVLEQARRRIEIPLASVVALRPWRCPLPGAGLDLVLASGARWALRVDRPEALRAALAAQGTMPALHGPGAGLRLRLAEARGAARRRWGDHAGLKFGLFPLLPAAIAFQLHQRITYGGPFGEWQAFGAGAWFAGLAIWWASWALGLMLMAVALRVVVEALATPMSMVRPPLGTAWRHALEDLVRAVFYLGVPGWLLWRVLAG